MAEDKKETKNLDGLGPDGEPEPIGNEAQRAAGKLVASTISKDYREKQIEDAKPRVIDDSAPKEAVKQEEFNKEYKKTVEPAYTQSSPVKVNDSPEPPTDGKTLGSPPLQVKAEGSFVPPA